MASRFAWARVVGAGVLAAALMLGASQTAATAASIRTINGGTLEVWETGGDPIPGTPARDESGLAYSLMDPVGTRFGMVVPAGAGTRDSSPVLALESVASEPVVAWSRWDGVGLKIAYARFENETWRDVHFVTFGTRADIEPRIGTSRDGAYLFWISDTEHYMYAPVNLTTGNLYASPREILPRVRVETVTNTRTMSPIRSFGREGGTDIPTVFGNCDRLRNEPCGAPPGTLPPARGIPRRLEGGTDVPVVIGAATNVWWVASNRACPTQVLVRPSRDFLRMEVIGFTNGRVEMLSQYEMPPDLPDGYAVTTANSYLQLLCM